MHELALAESVLAIVRKQATVHRFDRVTAVRLEIGALSCVAADAVEFCFAAVARGTLADGARLEVDRPPGEAWCLDCGELVALTERHLPCPQCGRHRLHIVRGEELRVKELEVA